MANKGYSVVLVSVRWGKGRKIVHRGWAATRPAAEQIRKQWQEKSDADYRVLGPKQLKVLEEEIAKEQAARKQASRAKAAAKRQANKDAGRLPHFILCPTCRVRTKLLYSEMGGLQTRRCQRGHIFTYDKWIADRAFWNPVAAIPHIYGKAGR